MKPSAETDMNRMLVDIACSSRSWAGSFLPCTHTTKTCGGFRQLVRTGCLLCPGMARHEQMLAGDADRFVAHFDATDPERQLDGQVRDLGGCY